MKKNHNDILFEFLQICQYSIFNIQLEKRGCKMTLMRGFAKVDKEGKIPIPSNIRRETDLKEGAVG